LAKNFGVEIGSLGGSVVKKTPEHRNVKIDHPGLESKFVIRTENR
jgi:hypothetical protein